MQALIRDVAYDALGPAERRARHLAAARYFERVDNDEQAGLLASHYLAAMEASSPGPEARALAIQSRLALVGAAERAAALGAHERATEYLRQAASLVDDDHVKIDLVIRAANSAEAGGAHETAEELAREAAALANALGNRADVGRALALTGEALIGRGLLHEAISVLEAALRAQDDGATSLTGAIDQSAGDPDGLAALLASLSRAQMRADLPVAAIGTADRALEIAERRGLDWIVAETFNNKGSSLCALGRKREAAALINAAIDVAREGGLVAAEVRATTNLAHMTEDLHLGRDLYLRSARLARRAGNRTGAMWAAAAARMLAYELAEGWDAAVAEAAVEITDAGPGRALPPLDEIRARYGAGLIRVARGLSVDTDIERLAELCNLVSDGIGRAVLHVLTGESALLGGDGRAAVAELLGAADALAKESTVFLAGAMRAAVWGRDLAAAREVAARLERDPSTSTPTEARRLVARAGVAALEGRAPDAARLYGDGIARLRNHGLAFEQARCTLDAAMLLSPAEPAIASELEAARRIFERVGAAPYLDRLAAITAGSGPREAARR